MMALPCPRPRKRNPAYTVGVFGGPQVGVTSILDMYIFGTIMDHAVEGFGFANPHQTTIAVEVCPTPSGLRTVHMIVARVAHGKLPEEICDLIVDRVIDLQRSNTQPCKVEMRQLKIRPEYPALHHYQLRTCDGVLLMYDVTSRDSFEFIQTLYEDVKKVFRVALDLRPFPFPLIVVGNKADLNERRSVPRREGAAWADSINRPFYETSMHDHASMEKAMHGITKAIYLYEELPLQFWRKPTLNEGSAPIKWDSDGVAHEILSAAAQKQRQQQQQRGTSMNCRMC